MEENYIYTEDIEIDIGRIFSALRQRLFLILLAAASGAVLTYFGSVFLLTPTYDSVTKIYILNRQNEDTGAITYNDLQSATQLTKDYMELVTTRPVLESVIEHLGLKNITYEELMEKISVTTETDGRIISIRATDEDPGQAKAIADEVRNAVSEQIIKVMDVEAVNVVEEANLPKKKARPSNGKNAVLGGALAFLLAVMIIVVQAVRDDRIKSEDDVRYYLEASVLGVIPLDENRQKKKAGKRAAGRKQNR